MPELFLISFLATLFTMDSVIFGQFGFSRPIVCGPLFGYLLGDIVIGINVGIILELIWINTIPIGTHLVPDVTAATILAVYWSRFISPLTEVGTAVVLSLIFAVPVSFIFRKSDISLRKFNSVWNKKIESAVEQNNFNIIDKAIWISLLIFVLKNFVLFLAALPLQRFLVVLMPHIAGISEGLNNAFNLLPAVGIGVFLYNFYDSVLKLLKR